MQDAVFQSRIATGNLLKLQKELENFLEEDYLKDLKILPSDEVDNFAPEVDASKKSSPSSTLNSSSSLLTAALSGAAHLI